MHAGVVSPLRVFKTANGGTSWSAVDAGLTGEYLYGLAIDPSSPSTLYAATARGLFSTSNGGESWTAVGAFGQLRVPALAVDPTARGTLYVAGNSYLGTSVSVFKTTDDGIRWTMAGNGLPDTPVLSLAIDPTSPSVLYAGIEGGLFKSNDSAATWRSKSSGLPPSPFVDAIAIDPVSPTTIYIGSSYLGVFKSIDGAVSWTPASDGLPQHGVVSLTVDRQSHTTVYAGTYSGVFKTIDGGRNWTSLRSFAYEAFGAVAVDPASPATLYAGTFYAGPAPTGGIDSGRILRSSDGGSSWKAVGEQVPPRGVRGVVIGPPGVSTVYVVNSAGAFRSADGGETWDPLTVGWPRIHVVYAMALALEAASPLTLFAGTTNGVYRIVLGGSGGTPTPTGGGPSVTATPLSPGSPANIPTLGFAALGALGMLLAAIGLMVLKGRR